MHCGDQRHATLSASDLRNARTTIRIPFYNMEYKIIKKRRQNDTQFLLPIGIRHSLQPLSTSPVMSQSQSTTWRHNSNTKTLLRVHVNVTEIVLKSTDRRSNITVFLHVRGLNHRCMTMFISRVIRCNCFSKMWRIWMPRILENSDLEC